MATKKKRGPRHATATPRSNRNPRKTPTADATSGAGSREGELKRYGRLYGSLHLAIAFTESINPTATKDPKRSRAWKNAQPLSGARAGAELLGKRGKRGNPVANLRASGLIGVESDTSEGLDQIQGLDLPETVTVQSSEDYKRHFWFRPPNGDCEYCAFRFEKDKVKADRERYFLVPPGRHPSGVDYKFLSPPGKNGDGVATLSQDQYDELVRLAKGRPEGDQDQDSEALDVEAILEGASKGERDESAYKFACSMRARHFKKGEALALMEAAHAAMEQPAGDEFPLEAALEKVHRAWRDYAPGTGSDTLIPRERPNELRAEAFHGITGEFVRLVDPFTEASMAPVLVQFLAQAGNAMGSRPAMKVGGDRHGTNLYVAIVGDTGRSRNGTSYRKAGWPIVLADSSWDERKRSGVSTGEGLLQMLQHDQMESIDSASGSGLTAKSLGRRIQIYQPEFALVLRKMRRAESILSSILRDLWDRGKGGNWTVKNPIHVEGAHLSLITHITELELSEELLTLDMANGFGNRFLWICAERSKLLPFAFEEDLPDEALEPIVKQLRAVLDFARNKAPEAYKMRADVRAAWPEIYERLEEPDPSLLGSMKSRSSPIVFRLAVIYAVLDRSDVIRMEHLQAALAVWDYAERSAGYLFGASTGNQAADSILRFAKEHPAGITKSEIYTTLFSSNKKAEEIDRSLSLLVDRGLLRKLAKTETVGRGRPAQVWQAID
jgi:hypothetical protein